MALVQANLINALCEMAKACLYMALVEANQCMCVSWQKLVYMVLIQPNQCMCEMAKACTWPQFKLTNECV
jgi:hypothetical protein